MTTPPASADSGGLPRPYGSFVLVRKLAEGGMAEIFLAKRREADGSERDVVIKRMLAHLAVLPDFVDMFRDEAGLAARLVHPNLVQVHEQGCIEGLHYIRMEFLPGEDFSQWMRTVSLRGEYVPVPLVLRVLADAARGLHYAHEFADDASRPLNIVHRDVSPSNLYVTYSGQVKVLDFGVAKAGSRRSRTLPGVVKGKYVYMAPEQARGEEVDRRADIFSLGVSLYEALTHVRPFARDDDMQVLHALLKGEVTPPRSLRPELSADLEAVVLKAMAHEPSQRYVTAAQFADALELLLSRQPSPATPAHVARSLRASFGESRYLEMTRVPSLASLGPLPLPAPTPRASVLLSPPVRSPAAPPAPRWRRRGVGLGVGGALLVGGALWFVMRPGREVAAGPSAVPLAKVSAAPVRAEAPVVPVEVSSLEAAPPSASTGVTARTRGGLEVADVLRVVSKNRARLSACFERFKKDLPGFEGDVPVRFVIAASGRADVAVQGALAERPVGRCLEKTLKRLRFPKHREKSVTVLVPLGYHVTP